MDAAVVKEEVQLILSPRGSSDLAQEALELLLVEGVVLDLEGEKPMALADRGTDCLAGLLSCAVLHCNVLVRR